MVKIKLNLLQRILFAEQKR